MFLCRKVGFTRLQTPILENYRLGTTIADTYIVNCLHHILPCRRCIGRSKWQPVLPRSAKKQLPMWCEYRVELYPHVGQLSGILDPHGNELEFPAAFRLSRSGIPKGIIQIVPDS